MSGRTKSQMQLHYFEIQPCKRVWQMRWQIRFHSFIGFSMASLVCEYGKFYATHSHNSSCFSNGTMDYEWPKVFQRCTTVRPRVCHLWLQPNRNIGMFMCDLALHYILMMMILSWWLRQWLTLTFYCRQTCTLCCRISQLKLFTLNERRESHHSWIFCQWTIYSCKCSPHYKILQT